MTSARNPLIEATASQRSRAQRQARATDASSNRVQTAPQIGDQSSSRLVARVSDAGKYESGESTEKMFGHPPSARANAKEARKPWNARHVLIGLISSPPSTAAVMWPIMRLRG